MAARTDLPREMPFLTPGEGELYGLYEQPPLKRMGEEMTGPLPTPAPSLMDQLRLWMFPPQLPPYQRPTPMTPAEVDAIKSRAPVIERNRSR